MAIFDDDVKYGFIIMDGNGSLFGVLHGNNKIVLHKFSVELPKNTVVVVNPQHVLVYYV